MQLERIKKALEPLYALDREIGGGGMSRVFLATERKFGRRIAIKVLAKVEAVSAERFQREIRLAASLQQANIVPLLEAGSIEGHPYYTMPFIEGQSLREALDAQSLTITDVVNVMRDMARALAFAHQSGVVHRDVKPENVLLSWGTAVMTDFGIAKAIDEARGKTVSVVITRPGVTIGTPAYMAPEQCVGDVVDQRADVYAWGLVAFEMLAGRHPFTDCESSRDFITAHVLRTPDYSAMSPDVPAGLVELVRRCLEKEPSRRPTDATRLVAEVDQAVIGAVDVRSELVLTPADAPSVAVMPFTSAGGSGDDACLADGISEEIMSALAHVRGLKVAARTSAFALVGLGMDIRTVGERLGVATVLEGSVRRIGSRVRVSVNLVSAVDGLSLWAERYDRELADIHTVQVEIARRIAETLQSALRDRLREGTRGAKRPASLFASEPELAPRRTSRVDVEAYEAYLRGRRHLDQRSTDLAAALASFELAIARDPDLSVAHAWLAHVYASMGLWYITPTAFAFEKVEAEADRALALDPNDAVAYAAKAIRSLWYDWTCGEALWQAQRAVEIAPGLPLGLSVMTSVQTARGEHAEAIAAAERALVLDPLSSLARCDLGNALRFAGQYADALRVVEPVVQRDPSHVLGQLWMAYLYDAMGEPWLALRYAEQAVSASARSPALLAVQARLLGVVGRSGDAEVLRAEMQARSGGSYIAPYLHALASLGAPDRDRTFALLEQSLVSRDCHLLLLDRDYFWQPIAGDPRFASLVERVGVQRS